MRIDDDSPILDPHPDDPSPKTALYTSKILATVKSMLNVMHTRYPDPTHEDDEEMIASAMMLYVLMARVAGGPDRTAAEARRLAISHFETATRILDDREERLREKMKQEAH